MEKLDLQTLPLTKYLFFTGKGGVGKTSVACAVAAAIADSGRKALLISTDPASNLEDVFETTLDSRGTPIEAAPGLVAANLDPIQAAAEYRERVVAPYRGKLPDAVIASMEEQLSGSCTVEIAAFNEFSRFITDESLQQEYDHILFDTAPTGHTLRMLQLPSAWTDFISESTHGASCLGQLAGLEEKKDMYRKAVETLADGGSTTLFLVTRPEDAPLQEAARAAQELAELGVRNQLLILNGVLTTHDDAVSQSLYDKQQAALASIPMSLQNIPTRSIPLRAYNVTGIQNIRSLLTQGEVLDSAPSSTPRQYSRLQDVVDGLADKKVIFTMGKGGVGKTTVAAAVALGLAAKGRKVHLTTTDPAAHLKFVLDESSGVTMSYIDEHEELRQYQEEVLSLARQTMSDDDLAYVEEDLRSPCTQEIAVFRAFARIVAQAGEQTVVIDTAPTGHTLLLLDATQSYHREIKRAGGEVPESVRELLPRLRNEAETAVIIVALAEATPVYEAMRLEDDLKRAGIPCDWWVINSSLSRSGTTNALLRARAGAEVEWLNRVDEHTGGRLAVIGWSAEKLRGEKLLAL